jgi:DNA-binding CsgD family transcriptional regulator
MLLEREGVLERLRELAADARDGRGRLVLVSGEAGIGKSSVVSAFVETLGRETIAYWGTSDAVSPPRPFAAIADMAGPSASALRDALDAADRDRVLDAFLQLIRNGPGRSRVFVLEDLHWADDATIDLLRVAGPRLRSSPVLVIGTYRDHEVSPHHPLRLGVGELPADIVERISIPALSADAVGRLAQDTLIDPQVLHRVTAGNAFFVTEVIAAFGSEIPVSVHDAVVARVTRLSASAQDVVRMCAVLGPRSELEVLVQLSKQPQAALEECLARGVLEEDSGLISFRHEVARMSILETIAVSDRVVMHAAALAVLRSRADADPARLARHATGAGDEAAILEFSMAAGDRAAALGAHREAAEHYVSAIELAATLPPAEHARLLQSYANESALLDDIPTARASQRGALAIWEQLGDVRKHAECLQGLSLIEYLAGDTEAALEAARKAVSLIDPVRPVGPEHGRAYAFLAQRWMVSGRDDVGAQYAEKAQRIAEKFGDEATAVHALTTRGATNIYIGDDAGWLQLEEACTRARSADLTDAMSRALINLVEAGLDLWRLDVADRYGPRAAAWFEDHDVDLYRRLNASRMAEVALRRGQWVEADRIATELSKHERTANVVQARALAILGVLAVRRGDVDPWPLLDAALNVLQPSDGSQELFHVRMCRIEASIAERNTVRARAEATEVMSIVGHVRTDIASSEGLFWAWRAGTIDSLPEFVAEPFRLHSEGRVLDAARAWRELGCPYYEALALAETNHAEHLLEALTIFHQLGAAPAARAATDQLRQLGAQRLPRGPRLETRRNPHGLTGREVEVLALLGKSMRNAEIAQRLVLSPKTVDHHVAAILRKLDVHDRAAAGAMARTMNLQDGVADTQDRESLGVTRS